MRSESASIGLTCIEPRVGAIAVGERDAVSRPTKRTARCPNSSGALADPTKVSAVHALSLRDLDACELAEIVRVTESAASLHLRVLRTLRLVRARRVGKCTYCALDDAHVTPSLGLGLAHRGHRERATVGVSA